MIGFGRKTTSSEGGKHATYYLFPSDDISHLEPFGDLPFAVVGIKQGKIQVIYLKAKLRLYQKPLEFDTITFSESVEMAKMERVYELPIPRFEYKEKEGVWMQFTAWKFCHCWTGNHMKLCHHAFFRLYVRLQQVGISLNMVPISTL
jgi:hypothetical protein